MSKPRYRWWGYVRNVIRAYPSMRGKQKDRQARCERDAVELAVEAAKELPYGKQMLEIIRLVYWEGSNTVDGAGAVAGYGTRQARTIHGEFVRMVAREMGLITDVR